MIFLSRRVFWGFFLMNLTGTVAVVAVTFLPFSPWGGLGYYSPGVGGYNTPAPSASRWVVTPGNAFEGAIPSPDLTKEPLKIGSISQMPILGSDVQDWYLLEGFGLHEDGEVAK